MRAVIGSQCKLMNRDVTCVLFDSLKINLAAGFWINFRGLRYDGVNSLMELLTPFEYDFQKFVSFMCCSDERLF